MSWCILSKAIMCSDLIQTVFIDIGITLYLNNVIPNDTFRDYIDKIWHFILFISAKIRETVKFKQKLNKKPFFCEKSLLFTYVIVQCLLQVLHPSS